MSDNLGMNTKNVFTMLGVMVGPWVFLFITHMAFYLIGDYLGHMRGVRETDCKDRGGHLLEGQCVKEVR